MQIASCMESKARVAGHPIHPTVVVFPIAMFTATVGALLAFVGTRLRIRQPEAAPFGLQRVLLL